MNINDGIRYGTWWFLLGKKQLPVDLDWKGPPVKMPYAVKLFKKKYGKTFVRKGRVYARIKRLECNPEQVLRRVLREEYVKSRVKSVGAKL